MSKKATQSERILTYLKEKGELGAHPTNIILDLGITQYSARIHELRELFGCECKHGRNCPAKEHIKNKDLHNGTTKFWYVNDSENLKDSMKEYAKEYEESQKEDQFDLF